MSTPPETATDGAGSAETPVVRRRLIEAGEGTNVDAFETRDWAALAAIATIWGSSFLLIELGLDAFAPGTLALIRVSLGAATLACFPRARRPVPDRGDRMRIRVLGWVWIGIPFLLFPVAQQHVTSAVAGMINGGAPVASALWATILLRRMPGRVQLLGIGIGFVGLVLVFLPELGVEGSNAFGATLLLAAVALYGLANNLTPPLQQKYGGLTVILRAQLSALVLIAPVGLWQLSDSTWSWTSALAMLPLGILGTGLALVVMADLVGRVGGARGSVPIYLVPVVAIILGVAVLGERIEAVAVAGMVLVLGGAWLTSRRERP